MKKLILLLFVILNLFQNPTAKAQTVTIPDAAFVTWLQAHYPTCMSGSLMDISCAALTVDTTLNLTGVSIANLDGIQYFTHLLTLKCGNSSLVTITSLPASLLRFNCTNSHIHTLPYLPNGIVVYIYMQIKECGLLQIFQVR
jgi:hypothetical protein